MHWSDDPLPRRFVRQANALGEWSVADLDFGYRICAFNAEAHGGVHLHGPEGRIRPATADEAERIVKVYAWTFPGGFTWERFQRCLKWRSE